MPLEPSSLLAVAWFTAGDDHPRGRARGGLSDSGMASWICGAFFLNGLISNAFSLRANLYVPQFSWSAIVEFVVPPAITLPVVRNSGNRNAPR